VKNVSLDFAATVIALAVVAALGGVSFRLLTLERIPFSTSPLAQPSKPAAPKPVEPTLEPTAPFIVFLGGSITFPDKSRVELMQIDDSRCKPEVVCIWAGELSAEIRYTDKTGGKAIHLGKESIPCEAGIKLLEITETTATFQKVASCE
jgi:hypothetical protein